MRIMRTALARSLIAIVIEGKARQLEARQGKARAMPADAAQPHSFDRGCPAT